MAIKLSNLDPKEVKPIKVSDVNPDEIKKVDKDIVDKAMDVATSIGPSPTAYIPEEVAAAIPGAAAGAVQGASYGLADEGYGFLKSLGKAASGDISFGTPSTPGQPGLPEAYQQGQQEASRFFKQKEEESPIAFKAAELVGAGLSPLNKPLAAVGESIPLAQSLKTIGKAAPVLDETGSVVIPPLLSKQTATNAGKAIASSTGKAIEAVPMGATAGVGYEEGQGLEDKFKGGLQGAATAAEIAGGLSLAGKAATSGYDRTRGFLGKKINNPELVGSENIQLGHDLGMAGIDPGTKQGLKSFENVISGNKDQILLKLNTVDNLISQDVGKVLKGKNYVVSNDIATMVLENPAAAGTEIRAEKLAEMYRNARDEASMAFNQGSDFSAAKIKDAKAKLLREELNKIPGYSDASNRLLNYRKNVISSLTNDISPGIMNRENVVNKLMDMGLDRVEATAQSEKILRELEKKINDFNRPVSQIAQEIRDFIDKSGFVAKGSEVARNTAENLKAGLKTFADSEKQYVAKDPENRANVLDKLGITDTTKFTDDITKVADQSTTFQKMVGQRPAETASKTGQDIQNITGWKDIVFNMKNNPNVANSFARFRKAIGAYSKNEMAEVAARLRQQPGMSHYADAIDKAIANGDKGGLERMKFVILQNPSIIGHLTEGESMGEAVLGKDKESSYIPQE